MKRSVLLISAFAVFGLLFTQCKKNTEVLPVVPTGEKINVSLNIPNNGGSKTSISDNGTIVWTGNDKIVVCYTEGTTTGVAGILSITNNVNRIIHHIRSTSPTRTAHWQVFRNFNMPWEPAISKMSMEIGLQISTCSTESAFSHTM